MSILTELRAPIFAVLGNHDHRHADAGAISRAMRKTGGRLLVNEWEVWQKGSKRVVIVGIDDRVAGSLQPDRAFPPSQLLEGAKVVALSHAPLIFDRMPGRKFDLALAGHSHGGQIRLPFLGALLTPGGVGRYQKGLYDTEGGPLYVNPGIGTEWPPVRLFCRPEVTCIDL